MKKSLSQFFSFQIKILMISMMVTFGMASLLFAAGTSQDHPDTPEVMMNEYIFTDFTQNEFVQTYGASTCVVVVLYHAESRTGALAHVSAETDIARSVNKMIRDFHQKGLRSREIRAELHGGWRNSSDRMVVDLQGALAKSRIVIATDETLKFVGPNSNDLFILPRPQPGVSHVINLQLHLATGEVTSYVESTPSVSPSSGILLISNDR